jgi:hypothetical protein
MSLVLVRVFYKGFRASAQAVNAATLAAQKKLTFFFAGDNI